MSLLKRRKKSGRKLKTLLRRTSSVVKKDTDTIVIVDCSSICYAALHTLGTLSYDGMKTGIIFGFLNKTLALAKKFKTKSFIFCWDAGVYHRQHTYPKYKQNRHTDMNADQQRDRDDLLVQTMKLEHSILPALGFHNNYIRHLYEADDLIGYWVKRLKGHHDLVVVTGDSDMFQLLNDCRIFSTAQNKMITKDYFVDRYGVDPSEWALAKAIGGCSGDNVEGIEGVSDPKKPSSKALKYLRGELTSGIVYDRITSGHGKELIARNLPLVTVPYKEEEMKRMVIRRDYFSRKKFIRVFDKYHFISFLKEDKFEAWKSAFL